MAEVNGDKSWIQTLRAVQVDLRALRDFASTLRADLDGTLRTLTPEIVVEHGRGPLFGGSFVPAVTTVSHARDYYQQCLDGGGNALLSYLGAAEVMIEATLEIAERYSSADAMARARAEEIDAALDSAQRRLLSRSPTAAHSAHS